MKKALVILLATCMLFAMAACSSAAPSATTAPSSAAAVSSAPAQSASAQPSAPATASVKTLNVFINDTWYPVNSFTGSIPDEITKETGVKLNPTIAVDDKQLGVMIASDSLPDLVYTSNLLDRLSNADISYSYDDLISKYNVAWTIDPLQKGNALSFSTDGKMYCVLNHFATSDDWRNAKFGVPMEPSLLMRQDLLNKLGNPKLDTLDDLTNVYAMVKAQLPGVTPLTFDFNWRFNVFRVWTGVTQLDFTKQDDGSYKYYIDTPAYHDMLKLLNSWFQKGYMIADSFAATTTTSGNLYNTGKSFSHTSCTQNGNPVATLAALDPSMITVESKPLGKADYSVSDIGWSGTFITKKCSDPETAIKFMQWMFTPAAQMLCQNGIEGKDYTLDANGIPTFSKDWMAAIADNTHNQKYNPWFYFGGSEIAEAFGRCASLADYDKYYAAPYAAIKAGYNNLPWITASLPTTGMDEKDVYDTIVAMIPNYEAKVIMSASDADFDKNYTDYMAAANSAGMPKLETYMSQKIPTVEKQYK